MNTTGKMIIVLTLIATLSGGVLSSWDGYTAPKIEQYRLEQLRQAIGDVLPAHETYEKIETDTKTFYVGKDAGDATVGIAFLAIGSGFQGEIRMMVGVTPDFSEITGLAILEQVETPGLGTKIVEDPTNKQNPDWFTDQFQGVDPIPGISVVKNQKPAGESQVQAITGATISSKSVVDILNNTIADAKELYQSRKQQVM
ncbi:MAG: FMN-binding protein [Candidatus Marinimicrobia bacterium]|nr:FMN-binding protein [Candidatus Neomarinimicrobiota bacterium]MCF7827342.1 FMN-binding protein [Candidatus Neomarinimicrobiota bacterium]MCF7881425.1 FMN-binding protein [Candidatus Neomarinimicrobiota bacterium]